MVAPAQEVIFAGAVEGLFLKGLGTRVTPALREELKAIGLDLTEELLPAYPRKVWNTALPLAVRHVWPTLNEAEGHYRLGRTIIDGFRETRLGRALVGIARVLGPLRTLKRMRQNLRTGANYNEITLTPQTATEVLFWINEPYIHPGYVQGLLHGSIEICGSRNSAVDIISTDANGTTYRVRWE